MPATIKPPAHRPYTTHVSCSYTTEFFSALQLLADSRHHGFEAAFAESVYKELRKAELSTLAQISTFPYQGLEFAEFYMKGRTSGDFQSCLDHMNSLPDADYLQILFDGIIPSGTTKQLFDQTLLLNDLIKKHPDLAPINLDLLETVFYHTQAFRQDVLQLFQALNSCSVFQQGLDRALVHCQAAVRDLQIACLSVEPETLVYQLIRKKWPLPTSEHYWFIPSYFVSPHHTLMIHGKSLAVLYDARINQESLLTAGTQIAASLSALTDKTRIEILRILISKPTYNRILSAMLNLTTATISHHLEILKKAGLITEQPYKKMRIYSANHDAIQKLIGNLNDYLYNR